MKLGIPLLITLASVQIASAASYTAYSDTKIAGNSYSDFNVPKFDTSLGVLTGVEVTVPISTLTGSATVTNPTNHSVTVDLFTSHYDVWDPAGTLGYAEQFVEIGPSGVDTTPAKTTPIGAFPASQAFLIKDGQSYHINPEIIASTYFSAYKGSGDVTFQINNLFSITTTGSSYTVSTADAGAKSQVAVTYTYDALSPVPESRTIHLSGIGTTGNERIVHEDSPSRLMD